MFASNKESSLKSKKRNKVHTNQSKQYKHHLHIGSSIFASFKFNDISDSGFFKLKQTGKAHSKKNETQLLKFTYRQHDPKI